MRGGGEVRGGEAFDLLQALNTGHAGSLSTIHANGAEQALARLASCVVQSGVDLPYAAVRRQIADAVNFVLHLTRWRGARLVSDLVRIQGYEAATDRYVVAPLLTRHGGDRWAEPDGSGGEGDRTDERAGAGAEERTARRKDDAEPFPPPGRP